MESLETTEIASQFLHKNEETSPAFSLVAQVDCYQIITSFRRPASSFSQPPSLLI
ncbi:hypothetical protein glysoja_044868 [Glycine soja]|uniref:Uncharacterized protein n=1 Tax=Glycine soja TaxID=3848 RepID=A0A0B2RTI9_GLYSO|nr:hypothetical protein glysoja_044868 [Glycine soja]